MMRSGGPDPEDWRKRTILFPPLPAGFGTDLTLVISGVELYDRVKQQQTGRDVPHSEVQGLWEIPLQLPEQEASVVIRVDGIIGLGNGRLVVESAVLSDAGLVITGHIQGIGPEQVPALRLEASLREADGRVQTPALARWGFGSARERVEFRFAVTTSAAATLQVSATEDPPPGAAAGALAGVAGNSGAFELDLSR
jgi:hypothetical protein